VEELLRFVAIRAPELVEPTDSKRAVPLSTNSDFQVQIAQAEPEARSDIAKAYVEGQSFIIDPRVNDLGSALLEALQDVDLSQVSTRTLIRKIVGSVRNAVQEAGFLQQDAESSTSASERDNEENLRRAIRNLVKQANWEALRVQLADSFLALSLFQEGKVRSTNPHESVLRLIHFVEQAAAEGLSSVDPGNIPNTVLATQISLAPEAPRPANVGEEPSPTDDPRSELVKNLRKVNRAADLLLSLPRAKLEQEESEGPITPSILDGVSANSNLSTANDDSPQEAVVIGNRSVFFKIKESALQELDPEAKEMISDRLEALGTNDIFLAATALRHDERQIYSKALPMPGMRVRGTTLTLANTALTTNISVREALDVVLNPGVTFNPDILGPEVFGLLSLPRFGALGIGELMVVRQNLKAYAALDVAHIENVLQGESKEREHRRKRLTEETIFTESETKVEEERDTQTSERFELRSEVQEEVKETFKFDAGVKVTAKLGPFVELEADARFGYENAKTEGRKKATQYSKETTERASTRYAERVLERRERRLVEEVEELNRHGIDATSANGNISGIYQWVNKIYEAQVFNYGLRQMYEFFLPEPATFYIGSLVSKGLSDGDAPTPPSPFTISPSSLNQTNYKYYTSLYNASAVSAPPEEFVKVDLAQAGGPLDFDSSQNGNVAAAFSAVLPDGYEYFGYESRWSVTYKGDNWWFNLTVSDNFGDPGTVPVYVQGNRIVSWAIWVHFTCRATSAFMDDWRLKAWEAMRDGHAQMQREYEEKIAAASVQQGIEITGRNPLANERIIRDEVQRQCISAFTNKSPAGNNGVSGTSGNVTVDWEKAYKKGLYTRFMQQAFEWENVSYIFYPFFWARKSRWLELFNIEDTDPDFQTFLQSGMARVVVPVRLGFEQHVEHFRRTGAIWSGGQPPTIGDPAFLSVAAEIKAQTGAPGDEAPVGEPWDIVVPTQLVVLRRDNRLPKWRKENGQWVEDNA
jgi:hypothetical protein